MHVVIDAEEGFGSRLVLDVDPEKVQLDAGSVTVISPEGKAYTALVLAGEGETVPAHLGDLYLISNDYVYFRKGNPAFVDGDTFDAATGDALFAGVNVFETRADAEAKALEVGGVLVLVGFNTSDTDVKGSSTVTTAFEFAPGGSSSLYGTDGDIYEGGDHTTMMIGSTVGTTVYGLNKAFNTSGNFTLIVKDSVFSGANFYITGNTYGSVMNGNIKAEITGSTIAGPSGTNNYSAYIGYGNFGTDEENPIDIDVTIKDSRLGVFRGINMSGTTATQINANINITVLDSTIGGHFYVINTADWVANAGANIYQSTYTAGSITVTMGGSSVTNTVRPGDSLTHGANALQVFNAPTTLHIVATEDSAVTQADWVMEWDTLIIDADARLELGHNLQFQTAYRGENANAFNGHDLDLDMAGTPITILVNMSGYEGGTHTVITAGEIYTDANLSSISVIGDNDLTGQCQLIYSGFRQIDSRYVLSRIGVFDKTDDMYVNASYTDAISGTTVGGQELFYGGNAHSEFDLAVEYASEWGGTIVVTGGNFEAQNFGGNNVDFQNGNIGEITMGSEADSLLKVGKNAVFTTADGSGKATMDIAKDATLGAVSNFKAIKFTADAEITAGTLDLSGTSIVVDVDDFTGSSHIVLTADAISGFDAANAVFIGKDADKYSMIQDGTTLVLKSAIQSNTYVNSEYTVETTGTILPDGTYLEYGFNAFSTLAEGAAALGGSANTLTVTGGSFADDVFELASGNLALADGVVINGVVVGNAKNAISVDGNVTLGGIEAISNITITTSSLLSADYIDLGTGGTIYVTGALGAGKVGNMTKIISTQAGISGASLAGDPGFYIYAQGNDVYLLDTTRIYLDPTFTEAVTGTTTFTGDTLIWGVNAFAVPSNTNLANATELNNALVTGGTLFISNWGTAGSQAGDVRTLKDVSIVAQGPTNFSIVFGNNGGGGHVVDNDINITVTNTGTPQGNTRVIHSNNDNARWTFNGNVIITFNGTGNFNTNASFGVIARSKFNGDLLQINMDGSKGMNNDADYWLFRDIAAGDYDNVKLIEVNITGVTTPNSKWAGLFAGNPNVSAKQVVLNMTDCVYRGGNWSYSLVDSGELARNTNFTVHLSGTTIEGLLSGQRKRDQNVPGTTSVYEGVRTLYVDGDKISRVQQAQMFNHFVLDARAQLIVNNNNNPRLGAIQFMAHNSSGQDSITIDVTNYDGADKMVLQAPSFSYGQQNASLDDIALYLTGDTEGKFAIGLGLSRGAFIITKNGDVLYNAQISTEDNGRAFGTSFILADHEDANAFNDYDAAKAAFDAHEAVNPGRSLFVSGNGDQSQAFYADGYAVTINGGTYDEVYGNDDEGSVASVSMKVTGGQFFTLATTDGGDVTGDARIELAGGKFGIPATYTTPDDPEEEPEIDEPEVPATIDGAKDSVGGVSSLVVSNDLSIAGSVVNWDIAYVNANTSVTGNFEATTITIDAAKTLKAEGDIVATTITIDATAYEGPTKVIAVSKSFESETPAVTIDGDIDIYDYRYVEDTLYLVSKNAGNVYLNSDWDESISGTIYNGELLVWGVNAVASMDTAIGMLTSDYTLFVTGGSYAGTYTFADNSKISIRDDATAITGLILGEGTNLTISGVTSGAVSIGSIAAVEGQTAGYNVVANSETAFGTIDGIRAFTFKAGQDISADGITYRENGGYLTVDFDGYTNGAGVGLQTVDGINNFLQYTVELADGSTVSRTTVGASNNTDKFMPYYDEAKKAVILAAPGEFAFLDPNASDADNGVVVTIDGKTSTKVYGYNESEWNVNSGRYTISGGTLFADGGEDTTFYWFFTAEPVNINIVNLRCGACVAGYNDDNPGHTRDGDFTVYAEGCTFTWFTAFAGQGTDASHQTFIVANLVPDDPEDPDTDYHYENGEWNLTFKGGTHDTNDFQVTNYANISGGTVNITFQDYLLRGDLQLFRRVYKNDGEGLEEVNVVFDNVTSPAAKWCYVWDPREGTDTKITITVTNSTFTGDDHTLGFMGGSTDGGWSGDGEFYISGFTMGGRLSGARGRNDQGNISNITGFRTLFVDGDNYARVIRDFSRIDVAATAGVLRANDINLSEASDIILRGTEGYTGDVREYIVAGNTISGILKDSAWFLDENNNEIEGYKAAIGDKTAFIYKTTGDVYLNSDYTVAVNGTTITDSDGKLNYLVFGDNAVTSFNAAIESANERVDATIQIENITARDFYTKGQKVSVNGGRVTNVYGGNQPTTEKVDSGEVDQETGEPIMVDVTVPADPVSESDITITSGATVYNVILANENSAVSGDATLTVGDGVAFVTGTTTGVLDGGMANVGGDSSLVFLGDASARTITGFDMVTLSADGMVELVGAFDGTAITIDATDYVGSTKKVLVAEGGFGDVSAITVTVEGDASYGYQFLDDGKTLVLTTTSVSDTFANTAWTEADVHNQFVGETALVWGVNAFDSFAAAANAIGQDATLTLDGGASTEDVVLKKNNDVIVNAGTVATSVGSITADGGALFVENDFVATSIAGFSALNLNANKTITVNGMEMAADSTITIDVTGYVQEASDVVVISTQDGITNLDTATISVAGENDKLFYAYYDTEDNDVHLMRVDNFYVDVAYGTAGENIQPGQVNPITGEPLIWGVNAFYYLNDGLNAMKPGQCLYINGRIGNNINTGDRMGNIYITNSTVPVLINGYTSGDQVYTGGDVWLTVENSTIATAAGSFLFGTVTMGEAWNHNQHILGNMTVNVIGSTIGGDTGAILVSGMNFVNVLGTAEEAATITFNFVDTIIRDDFTFVGDSPLGKDETFQGVTRKGANLVMNFDNVLVPQAKWWRIMDGDQESTGTVTVSIKGSTIGDFGGENMRFSLGSWQYGDPRNHQDFNFTIEDSIINGYLQSSKHDDGNHAELVNFDGKKSIVLKGDNIIRRTYWFDEITLTAGATLTGSGIRMASKGGTINVDVTGYTGKSKVLVSMNDAFENVSQINVTGAEGSEYKVLTSDRAIVIKGAVKDMYVNSTYTAETCPAGTVYNGELLFFGENAFALIDEAVPLLTDDAVLYITGGTNLLDLATWTHSISIDATAEVDYAGSDVITIAGDLANAGLFVISAAGFVGSADITVLTATSITGDGTFATDDDTYLVKVVDGTEVHLIQKKTDVFVNTEWADLADGTTVTIGEVQATVGIDAFATADAASAAVAENGTIILNGGTLSFNGAIVNTVVAQDGVVVENTNVGTGTAIGSLTLQSGSVGKTLAVRGKGILAVESGVKVSGLGMVKGASVTFAAGSVLDFDISGTTAGASPSVTNFSVLQGTPDYTITLLADQAEGEYQLASDAASFNSVVTLFVGDSSIGTASLEAELVTTKYTYTLGINDDSVLVLSVTENVLPEVPTLAYVNSEWTGLTDGTTVTVGTVSATIGYDAFADLAAGIAGVTDDGSVEVVAGTVSFADGYSKTITVDAEATVVGTATFDKALTIDGTILFDTAIATAEAAQFDGFSYITGETKYVLASLDAAKGTYLLASDAADFAGSIVFGEYTLTVGGEAVVVGDLAYSIGITDNNDLALLIDDAPVPPTPDTPVHAFVSSEWTGLADGTIVTVAGGTAKIGYDAFATLAAGIAGVTADGSVEVVGGEVSFADGYYKTITVDADATVIGTASFLNLPITINGTMAFDVALTTRTAAQFADIQFVSGDTQYTLTVDNPTVGTYMLASGLWYDANYQPVFTGVVKFGENELTVGNDITIGDFTYGLRTTGNLELMLVVDKAVAPTAEVSFINACLDGTQNMIGKIFASEEAGFSTEIKFYTLDGNVYGMSDLIEDGWTFAGVGDFNGDGMDGMLRFNNTNGLVVSDNANGNGTFTPAVLNLKNASWDIIGTGDFNGDGFDDVLVANRTASSATVGLLGYWSKGTEWTLINGYSDEWTLVDTGDYDGNGCCDMLWKNSFVGEGGGTYNAYCTWRLGDLAGGIDWSIVMVAKVNETETPDTDAWSYLTTGDFNGDGISDIAMINDVGTVAVATMAADGTSSAWTVLSVVDTSSWNLAGTTDLNLDGVDDIIWCQDEVAGVGSLAGYWQINADEYNHPVMTSWQNIGWLA